MINTSEKGVSEQKGLGKLGKAASGRDTGVSKKDLLNFAEDPKRSDAEEAKLLDSRWSRVEKKFLAFSEKSKSVKIKTESNMANYGCFCLTKTCKIPYLRLVLREARRKVVHKYEHSNLLQEHAAAKEDTFSMHDASNLLTKNGNEDMILKMKHHLAQKAIFGGDKKASRGVIRKRLPFIFYKLQLHKSVVFQYVKEAHEVKKTFSDMYKSY
eukprot:CAMPEP_0119052410 /NCGR_PEP_ID=MMETSP1177-20130426/73714_1 /TAXON_ID=2985 /ORGANISM="Ochromonas sp, Strain CCMP1899" /LENGTH=211 /DNA_ID=CAMNT_0007031971 /DNA_START=1446 /DNA_END=2081 /DNA_ORIENTATION=-